MMRMNVTCRQYVTAGALIKARQAEIGGIYKRCYSRSAVTCEMCL